MTGSAQIIHGDSRRLPLADDSVDLVITSPPYFALRSYTDGGEHYDGQIGAEATPDEFVSSLLEVTAECVRVLKPTGSLWVNLGDKYDSGTNASRVNGGDRLGDGRTRQSWNTDKGGPERATIGRPKSLLGIPWRYALRCIDDLGLILRAEVIWSKPNGLPESVTDRVRRSHEQWFHFTLQPRYFSAVDEIREAHARSWGGKPNGGGYYRDELAPGVKDANLPTAMPNPLGKLPGSVWTVPTEPLRVPDHLGVDHFAAFPTEWPRRIIAGWSPAGVCTACGEGRRPVVAKVRTNGSRGVVVGAAFRPDGRWETADGKRHEFQTDATIAGYACACPCALCGPGYRFGDDGCRHAPAADTTPAVVLDPFGGTGTTALVAKALGRHGITVDMSADYCRLAEWRVNDPASLAHAMRVDKPQPQTVGQESLLDLFDEETA